jgi:hypothetical protein
VKARLAVVSALALLAAGCMGGDEESPAVPQGRYVATSRSLTPDVHLFGDSVVARVEVVVDRDHLDPGRVRLKTTFQPYERVGSVRFERRNFDRYTRLRYETTLRCLDAACLAPGVSPGITPAGGKPEARRAERIFLFRPAHVYYDNPRSERPEHLKRVWWPRLETLSRISSSSPALTFALNTPFRTTLVPLPSLSYAVASSLLGAALLVAALLLLALPAWLTWSWLRKRRPPPPAEEPELSPLERALLLVEWARERVDSHERRGALEMLAFELDASGRKALADEARALAWSPAEPSPTAADELVRTVKETDAVAT